MDESRAVISQTEGRPLGKIIMALALLATLFSFVVLPGNVAAAGELSGDTLTIVLVIVVVAIVAIVALVLMGSKKGKSSAPKAKAAPASAAKADEPAEEPGHNEGGKCSKCGAPMLDAWDVCPKCAGRILLGEITK